MQQLTRVVLDKANFGVQADGIFRGMLGLSRDAQLRESDIKQSSRCAAVQV